MPREVADELAEQIIEVYRVAWAQVVEEQLRIAEDPLRFRRRARLEEVRRRIEALMSDVDAQSRQWLSRVFPRTYAQGGLDMAATIGSDWVWTQPDIDAVTSMAGDLFDDLLAATRGVSASTRRFIRQVVRTVTTTGVVKGETAVAMSREVTRLARDRGIHSVTYRGGRRVGLASYAEMAVRTKTAVAYNASGLLHANSRGVTYVEIFDGADCGWTSHDDPDLASGSIRPIDDAMLNLIAHPRCRRAIGARVDITNDIEALGAQPSTTAGQREDQAAFEAELSARAERRAARRRRAA